MFKIVTAANQSPIAAEYAKSYKPEPYRAGEPQLQAPTSFDHLVSTLTGFRTWLDHWHSAYTTWTKEQPWFADYLHEHMRLELYYDNLCIVLDHVAADVDASTYQAFQDCLVSLHQFLIRTRITSNTSFDIYDSNDALSNCYRSFAHTWMDVFGRQKALPPFRTARMRQDSSKTVSSASNSPQLG